MQTLTKQPGESILFNFDYGAENVIAVGQSITAINSITITNCGVVSGSTNASTSSNAFSGRVAQTLVIAGQHGESYKLRCLVNDSAGQTNIELDGLIEVIET